VSNVNTLPALQSLTAKLSDLFWRRPKILLLAMLLPAVLWLGVIYIGSLVALLIQSFFSIDEFSGLIKYELTLKTYLELLRPANLDIIVRTVVMAASVTLAAVVVAFPIAFYAARYAKGRWKAIFYVGIMLPLWSSCMETHSCKRRYSELAAGKTSSWLGTREYLINTDHWW